MVGADPMVLFIAALGAISIVLITLALAGPRQGEEIAARLARIGGSQATPIAEVPSGSAGPGPVARGLRAVVRRLSGFASRLGSAAFTASAERRLGIAGRPGEVTVAEWLAVKLLTAGALAVAFAFYISARTGATDIYTIAWGIAGLVAGWLLPEVWLSRRIGARQQQIIRDLPDAIDLLAISVRAGLGFDAALAKVVEKLPGPVSDEYRRALAEIRMGKARKDALRDIVARTEVAPLRSFVAAVIQADQLGVPIAKVLQVQSEQMRIERRQRAEEMAAKAPIKMLIPLVGCIFPSLFIVILGPALIAISRSF